MDSAVASAMPHSGFDHANVASVATVASGSTEASHAMRTPLSGTPTLLDPYSMLRFRPRSNHSPPTASGGGARTGSHGHGAGVESEQVRIGACVWCAHVRRVTEGVGRAVEGDR
eukprot:1807360-Rhodomonas_salina.2